MHTLLTGITASAQDRNQKRVRKMLLLLPDEVVGKLSRVKSMFREIAKQLAALK